MISLYTHNCDSATSTTSVLSLSKNGPIVVGLSLKVTYPEKLTNHL